MDMLAVLLAGQKSESLREAGGEFGRIEGGGREEAWSGVCSRLLHVASLGEIVFGSQLLRRFSGFSGRLRSSVEHRESKTVAD